MVGTIAAIHAAPAPWGSRPQTLLRWRTIVDSCPAHSIPQMSVRMTEALARGDFISLRRTMCGSKVTRDPGFCGCSSVRQSPGPVFPLTPTSTLPSVSSWATGRGTGPEGCSTLSTAATTDVTLVLSLAAIAIGSMPHLIASCRSISSSRARRSMPVTMILKMNGALNPQRLYSAPATGGPTRLPRVRPMEAIPN